MYTFTVTCYGKTKTYKESQRMGMAREYNTNDVAKEYFGKFEGKKIIMPERFMPNKSLLEKHRNLLVV